MCRTLNKDGENFTHKSSKVISRERDKNNIDINKRKGARLKGK